MATPKQILRAIELLSGHFDTINTDGNAVLSEKEIRTFLQSGALVDEDLLAIKETLKVYPVDELSTISILDEYQNIPNTGISRNDLDEAPQYLALGLKSGGVRPPDPPSRTLLKRTPRMQEFDTLFSSAGNVSSPVPEAFINSVLREPLCLGSQAKVTVQTLKRIQGPLGVEYEVLASIVDGKHRVTVVIEEDFVLNVSTTLPNTSITEVDGTTIQPVKIDAELLQEILRGNYELAKSSTRLSPNN